MEDGSLDLKRKCCLASAGANNDDVYGCRSSCWRHYGDLDLVSLGENLVFIRWTAAALECRFLPKGVILRISPCSCCIYVGAMIGFDGLFSFHRGCVSLDGLWISLWGSSSNAFTSLVVELRWSLSFSSLSSRSLGDGSLTHARLDYMSSGFIRPVVSRTV
jgi:hypothetical protein